MTLGSGQFQGMRYLDAHDAAGQVDQDRREGRTSCPVRDIPTGGGGRPASIVPSDPGADPKIRGDPAKGSSGTTGMKRLPANSRGGAWDADLSTAPLKGVPIGSQDLFRGRNPAVSGPILANTPDLVTCFAETAVQSHSNGPAMALGKGQMGNVGWSVKYPGSSRGEHPPMERRTSHPV